MKVAPPANQNQNDQNRSKRGFAIPVIGLDRPPAKEQVKGQNKTTKIRCKRCFTNPVICLERPCEKDRLKRHYETLKLCNHPEKGDTSSQFSFVLDYYSTGDATLMQNAEQSIESYQKNMNVLKKQQSTTFSGTCDANAKTMDA
jgi:hypothetical protein